MMKTASTPVYCLLDHHWHLCHEVIKHMPSGYAWWKRHLHLCIASLTIIDTCVMRWKNICLLGTHDENGIYTCVFPPWPSLTPVSWGDKTHAFWVRMMKTASTPVYCLLDHHWHLCHEVMKHMPSGYAWWKRHLHLCISSLTIIDTCVMRWWNICLLGTHDENGIYTCVLPPWPSMTPVSWGDKTYAFCVRMMKTASTPVYFLLDHQWHLCHEVIKHMPSVYAWWKRHLHLCIASLTINDTCVMRW